MCVCVCCKVTVCSYSYMYRYRYSHSYSYSYSYRVILTLILTSSFLFTAEPNYKQLQYLHVHTVHGVCYTRFTHTVSNLHDVHAKRCVGKGKGIGLLSSTVDYHSPSSTK